jgi:hypothetical protein
MWPAPSCGVKGIRVWGGLRNSEGEAKLKRVCVVPLTGRDGQCWEIREDRSKVRAGGRKPTTAYEHC